MKLKLFFSGLLLSIFTGVFGQAAAKKPTIMIVPGDNWCLTNGYMEEYDNQGKSIKIPDYRRALQESTDLILVISKINELMIERGYSPKSLESSLKSLETNNAEDAMLSSKSGSGLSESNVDKLKKVAKADIWISVIWTVNKVGPNRSITFNLEATDAYTDKKIAIASGTGQPSFTAELPILLQEAVLNHLDNFNSQLMTYFEDMLANGRVVSIAIKKFDSFDGDLESEYDGKELNEIIEEWISNNAFNGSNSGAGQATENQMFFESVRIPLFSAEGKSIDARGWLRGLQKFLKEKYQIESKLMTRGLGFAQLVIGEK